ncbi:Gfo/Idh/MocA family oxidoreductase [Ruegeria sp. 2012CJ41-6]|uniref:Gfo/Idh/MocA family oxidoreductase n=1 Tax=Ruegeria spongiae TaxID=2942209 RepID=A0ABT0Q292_9RHOB|nr:Gfo/Idh/MocA family oxidoreductase [Ruegeria spongiae]MCL6283258.1 Gfo/Idh/MocA family oxidoreductase [Ruegeria spongiae]
MTQPKRILVIGAGLIGSRHVAAVHCHPGCVLAGVVDADPARADETAPFFRDLFDVDVPVDGAIIATPTGLHHPQGVHCAARCWHMLIEKPVATTVEQAHDLAQIAARAGVRCLVGHHRRYHPAVDVLREVVGSGAIGDPISSTLIWSVRKPEDYFSALWRQSEGSPVMINLVHDIDLLRFVLGEITDICGFGAQPQRAAGRVESGAVALRFASGACGTISFADTAPSPWGFEAATGENPNIATTGQDMWWITGTSGAVSFPSLTLWTGARDWSQAPSPARLEAQRAVPLDAQLGHFLEVIDGTAAPIISLDDAARSLQATCRIEALLAADIKTGDMAHVV